METATRLVPLPSPAARPVASPAVATASVTSAAVRVDGDRLVVERLVIADATLATFVGERDADDRPGLVERALRIGLTALLDAGVTVNVDAIRVQFQDLVRQTEAANERAASALDALLRQNFADGDGRLPRTLERFLGDRGQLRSFVAELFDESRRDSAIGRMRTLLGTYFDGDASRLAQLLDPTRLGSPLHQFRTEMADGFARLNDRLTALEAAAAARAGERAKSAAKGADLEALVEAALADIARGSGDLVERTATETGAVMGSKKGDFVVTVDPGRTGGADLRVVVECKDRAVSGRVMRDELREARTNRSAAVALVVFTPAHAPTGIAPFDVRAGDVYCVLDPAAPDPAILEAALRLARLFALATLRDREVELDAAAVAAALAGIREQLELVRGLKATLTSIATNAGDVRGALDRLREAILARVAEAEAELKPVAAAEAARPA
ncbi:MAG TPA: hypothetical protein VF763_03455 [Candidatus Limnocylindrales bacterium]